MTVCITLRNFDASSICHILSNLLHRDARDVQDLATIVHSRTGGSIYFAIQYVRLLYDRQLITYSLSNYRWEYSCGRILSDTDIIADNVIQLVCNKITSLPPNVRLPVTIAAFLGMHQFDANILYLVTCGLLQRATPSTTAACFGYCYANEDGGGVEEVRPDNDFVLKKEEFILALDRAVDDGLLDKINKSRSSGIHLSLRESNINTWYKFSHDRVREGALLSLGTSSEEQRRELHMHIGQVLQNIREAKLWSNDSDDEDMMKLLVLAVQHLNDTGAGSNSRGNNLMNGSGNVVPYEERVKLAQLNLEAADYAIQKTAYPLSVTFLTAGLDLLDKEVRWQENYDLTLRLASTLTHARFCCGLHQDNWDTMEEILDNARSTSDKYTVHRIFVLSLRNEGRFREMMNHNFLALKELNVWFPRRFLLLQTFLQILRTRLRLRHTTVETFLKLEKEAGEDHLRQIRLLGLLLENSVLICNPLFRALTMSRAINFVLDEQIKDMSALGLAGCAFIYGIQGCREKSYRYGRCALDLTKELPDSLHKIRILGAVPHFMLHWREPYHNCLEPLLTGYRLSLETGLIETLHQTIIRKLYLNEG